MNRRTAPFSGATLERAAFRRRHQAEGETVAHYFHSLERLAAACGFGAEAEGQLREQFVAGLSSDVVRNRILYCSLDLDCHAAAQLAQALEDTGGPVASGSVEPCWICGGSHRSTHCTCPGPAPTAERVYNNHGAQVVPVLPSISSSLAAYVRQDLTGHVSGWPTDRVEHQIRQAEDLFQISHIKYSMVSSQLKGARAGVRHTEIINTHLQARLLCLRQEIEKLEKESKLPDSGS